MNAVMCHAPHNYRYEDVPIPYADVGEIIIKVNACGVCASDIKCFTGAPLFWGDETRPTVRRNTGNCWT